MKHLFVAVMAMIVSVTVFGQEVRNPDFRKGFSAEVEAGYMLMFRLGTMCFQGFMSGPVWG